MSYTRKYHEVVHGSKTETVAVSYPASQNGGTTYKTVTVHIDIPVNVNIHVDTNPFDNGVRQAGNHISLLTGAVVATESAAVISKRKSAGKVGEAIVQGFFGYVRSEISQQVAEISQQTDALLLHIKSLSDACIAKKTQMATDYNRISSRYLKLFNDLNKELSTRIHQLDRPAFLFKHTADELIKREKDSGSIGSRLVFNAENTDLQVRISSAMVKKQAVNGLEKIVDFLSLQKDADDAISKYVQRASLATPHYIPICIGEARSGVQRDEEVVFFPNSLPDGQQQAIRHLLSTQTPKHWKPAGTDGLKQIMFYFHKALNQQAPEERIRKTIHQIVNL